MTNRLRKFLRVFPRIVGVFLLLSSASWLSAQPGFFNFSYGGPTTLSVDSTCTRTLNGIPDPTVTSTVGATITMSMFDPAMSGFDYNTPFTPGFSAQVFWFVKDNAGHQHTFSFFVFFVDDTPPVFDLTGINASESYLSVVQVPPPPTIPVSDNCVVDLQNFVESPRPDTCVAGSFTRTWTATDPSGNVGTFVQTINIAQDVIAPFVTSAPQNGSAPCDQLVTAYPAWLATQMANFTATDASGISSYTNNAPPTYSSVCPTPLLVTFKVTDNCGFMTPRNATFSSSDTQGPVVVVEPKDTVAYCSPGGNHLAKLNEWIHNHAFMQVTDACSPPVTYTMQVNGSNADSAQVVAAFQASFANGCGTQLVGSQIFNKVSGLVSVDFFVWDACGNQTFGGNAEFAAIDTLPPVITGFNTTEQCGAGNDQTALQNWIVAHGNATLTDDCSSADWVNFSYITSTGQSGNGNFNLGPYPNIPANDCDWYVDVTFRAADECGNSSSRTLRFSIVDTQGPVFVGLQPNITVYCPNPLPTTPAALVGDNCDANVAISFSRVYQDSLCDGSYTVVTTWLATDDCGNTTTAIQNIFVRDTTAPIFSLVPAPKTFRCDTFVLPPVPVMGMDISASDICSPVVSISTQTLSQQDPDPAVCGHYTYNIIRTFTATDECGNTKTATQVLSVVDNLGPVPNGLFDTVASCDVLPLIPLPPPTATDACSGPTAAPVNTGQNTAPGPCPESYTLILNWVATDVCGNATAFDQNIELIDTIAPTLASIPANITVECDAIPAPPATASLGADDNCAPNVSVNVVDIELRNPDPSTCDHWTNYTIRREWTATDPCGNARTYSQLIHIQDTQAPSIVAAPALTLPTDPGQCGATVGIPAPLSLTDVCTSLTATATLRDTALLVTTTGLPNNTTPVDTMHFQWVPPNLPPDQPVTGSPVLTIFLDNADAEGASEFLNVFGENSTFIGTVNTPSQCGSSTKNFPLTTAQLNAWMSDGSLTLTLAPNGSGSAACNPVCANGRARATLAYQYTTQQVPIELEYSLDGNVPESYPPAAPTFWGTGTHSVVYIATDCAGNSATASLEVIIQDTEAPSVTAPAPLTAYTGQIDCQSTVSLPFPGIFDNCNMSGSLIKASAIVPVAFQSDPDAGIVPTDTDLPITGLIPNAVSNGILKIRHKGDNNNAPAGEFFSVYDENNALVGVTSSGSLAGECAIFHESILTVSAAQINAWAANGSTVFKAISNKDAGSFFDFIAPCGVLQPNQTDGVSQLQAVLEYSYAVVDFTVKKPVNQIVASGALVGNSTMVTLLPGDYTVMYTTADAAGLSGMTSFPLTVRDTVKPIAICQPTLTIFVNPSGAQSYNLLPAEINNGSNDNCSPTLSYQLSQSTFSCNQAGSNFTVTLTATDTSGNSATCNTIVRVENTPPEPTYTPVCAGAPLQLFANPPTAPPNTFTYLWNGPNTYVSNQANPVITNNAQEIHEGTYCVTITGATGCTSSACVTVDLAILSTIPQLSANGFQFCQGQNVVLATPTYQGQNVSYQWFVDSLPGDVLLGTTSSPLFTITAPPSGQYTYFVRVLANGCNTVNSTPLTVTVFNIPPVSVTPTSVTVCEGQPIALGTNVQQPGLTYVWTGPGFMSAAQYPLVTSSAAAIHAGNYTLITQQNGCQSPPATVPVTVNAKPATPQIAGNGQVCEGDTVTLVSSVNNAAQYFWTSPALQTTTTTINALTLPTVTAAQAGAWTLVVRSAQGCSSDPSAPFQVQVQAYPVVTAASNGPICQDSLLQLSATASFTLPSWCWTGPGTYTNFTQNPAFQPAASGVYTVIGKTSFGCADTASVTVNVVQAPVIGSVTNDAPTCCDGTTDATLQASVITAFGPPTYLWTGPFGTSTLASPVIADVCTDDNGQYTLVVKDTYGCPSAPQTTAINVQAPPATPIVTQPAAVCAGATVMLTVTNPSAGAQYTWLRPGVAPDTVTTQSFLSIPNAIPGQSGLYQVIATVGPCPSDTSSPVNVVVNSIPAAPTASSNSPICEGETLQLYASTVSGATYMWMGPNGYTSILEDPVVPMAGLTYNGQYSVVAKRNGCTSPVLEPINVQIKPKPLKPTILPLNPAPICLDAPGATLTLNINASSQTSGAQYTWLDAVGDTIFGPSPIAILNLTDLSQFAPGQHSIRVFATKNGCESDIADAVLVRFDTIPASVAYAGEDRQACATLPIALNATTPSAGTTGIWSQLSGPVATILNPNNATTQFTGAVAGNAYTFMWRLSSGGCVNFSADTVVIQAENPEAANAGVDTFLCAADGLTLNATQGQTAVGTWSQMGQIGVVIADPASPNTSIQNLNPGNRYFFIWTLGDIGCGTSADTVTVYNYSVKPQISAPLFVCSDEDCAPLQAQALQPFEFGQWTSNDSRLTFTPPNTHNALVCNLQRGPNTIFWTTNGGACGSSSRDTIVINYELFPTAVADAVAVEFGNTAEVSVLPNDILPDEFTITIVVQPIGGSIVDTLSEGIFVYRPNSGFSGTDMMEYRICNTRCPDACSGAIVTFEVGAADDCFIPTIITPNGDNLNDFFQIPAECYPEGAAESEVSIFNQWGDQVFYGKPYLNNWDGTYKGDELPVGTYYYVVKLNAVEKPRTGFLLIQR